MGMEFELEESEFSGYIPDGDRIRATVTNIKQKEANWIDDATGQKAKRVEFTFVLSGVDREGQDQTGTKLWGETPMKFNTHPDCKLRNWAENLLGRRLPPRYRLNTDELINKDCILSVQQRQYDDKKSPVDPTTGEYPKKTRNDVYDVFPTPENAASIVESLSNVGAQVDEDEPF